MATDIPGFIARWRDFGGEERANKDSFFIELCEVLAIAPPQPKSGDLEKDTYVFEADVPVPHEGGAVTTQKADVYKAGAFVLEAKQGRTELSKKLSSAKRGTDKWQEAMASAKGQALGYASMMVKPPPFLIVADLGYCFDLYASFEGSGQYAPFPGPRLTESRLFVADLARHADLLRTVLTDPRSLDPAARIAKITTTVAAHLAGLASTLEKAGHPPELVAKFLMRCLFTMFAEDVGLLAADPRSGRGLFTTALQDLWIPSPSSFPAGIEGLWRAMNAGSDFGFMGKLLRFNGGLFAESAALPLDQSALADLLEAAKHDWSEVDPAIFGTLLERALSPKERHALGAHYTPRSYVERLVRPTVEEPVRADWDVAQAEVRILVEAGKVAQAKKVVRAFHQKLCQTRVLDPACGSGNFLYVALDLFQRIEDEVLDKLEALGETQQLLAAGGLRVTPAQFLGIEKKPWAKEIAELVLWIGYLQHHVRARGKASPPPEPVLQDYKNIECRDAVLAYDREELVVDERGKPVTRWDGETMKKSPVTGKLIPDEAAQVPVYRYLNPRRAKWPRVDYVVGNPPFIGTKRMKLLLGDGYVEALRNTYSDVVADNADLVMYWWNKAARRVATGKVKRAGLITTNSITQNFNRRVVSRHVENGVSILWAIADHPWSDSETGAAVRIAMTVLRAGDGDPGILCHVTSEHPSIDSDAIELALEERVGVIGADLRIGASVAEAGALRANLGFTGFGVALHGRGFVLLPGEAQRLRQHKRDRTIRPYLGGRDLSQVPRERYVIDFSGLNEQQARSANVGAFQHVIDHVLPERQKNRRDSIRKFWWRFGWERPLLRNALRGLPRFIATTETSKHRVFQFLDGSYLADHGTIVIATADALHLGLLSSRIHITWALAAGGRLGVGNDPRYNKLRCFDPFPFPAPTKPQAARIRDLGEQLDAHRKRQQAAHPALTITGMYNVLGKLGSGEALTAKDKVIHAEGLVSVLRQIHDDLDRAVFEAYGWPIDLSDEEILEKLVALNAERAEEEKSGLVRWLRPELQDAAHGRGGKQAATQMALCTDAEDEGVRATKSGKAAWPKRLDEQLVALRELMLKKRTGWTAKEVAETFRGVAPKSVSPLLDTLASLGVVVAYEAKGERKWRAARAG